MTIRELINCCDNIKDKYVLKIMIGNKKEVEPHLF